MRVRRELQSHLFLVLRPTLPSTVVAIVVMTIAFINVVVPVMRPNSRPSIMVQGAYVSSPPFGGPAAGLRPSPIGGAEFGRQQSPECLEETFGLLLDVVLRRELLHLLVWG